MASPNDKGGQTGKFGPFATIRRGHSNNWISLVDLAALSVQQLSQLKKQLDTELEHLTGSFQSLRGAQTRFRDCLKSINSGVSSGSTGTLLARNLTPALPISTPPTPP